jgi:hypothetical protein
LKIIETLEKNKVCENIHLPKDEGDNTSRLVNGCGMKKLLFITKLA